MPAIHFVSRMKMRIQLKVVPSKSKTESQYLPRDINIVILKYESFHEVVEQKERQSYILVMGTRARPRNDPMLEKKEEDHMNELSDEILVSILCRLSLDEAARTIALSRRWKSLWTSSIMARHRLELAWNNTSLKTERCKFAEWVEGELKLRRSTSSATLDILRVQYDLNS
ncbi:hypothetical protein FEM48_Zijuj09G0060900 [Ziziphus jujuba var. spinosa]|uniref:F-box domain-containing protein n=1 Tax=Ziziphus jujuba var. spinosa TaxID=714518 RepID=A0A978URB3_ZIZJJ|nr:hypothetical protein FEM48_Zijuj09G0060900 [Ziziphus jujuba var. spinosa]